MLHNFKCDHIIGHGHFTNSYLMRRFILFTISYLKRKKKREKYSIIRF